MEHISIVIPFMGNDPVRVNALANLLNVLEARSNWSLSYDYDIVIEILLVEQFMSSEHITKSTGKYFSDTIQNCKHIPIVHSDFFNKSWCINVGISYSKYDTIVIIDADTLFGADFLYRVIEGKKTLSEEQSKIFFCWTSLLTLPGKNNPIARMLRPDMTCALGGVWSTEKEFFFQVLGGMNENFKGYGGEDNEIWERATFCMKKLCNMGLNNIGYSLVHQYHDWAQQNTKATPYLEITKKNTQKVINILRKTKLGNIEGPIYIDMEAL